MGRHQQAEASGIISFMACATLAWIAMDLYLQFAPAIWRVTQRLFTVCAGITAGCGVISFTLGYARNSRSMTLKHGWTIPIRRIFEILALSVVYASTIFVTAFMLLSIASNMMGLRTLKGYLTALCAAISGVVGYVTFVQAELMNAKTIASLLPFFVVSGVSIAGLTSDDPYWYNNNFSQLGDRTTFAARMFNSTLMLAASASSSSAIFAIFGAHHHAPSADASICLQAMKKKLPNTSSADSSAIDHADARRHRLHRHRHVPLHAASDSAQRIRPRSSLPDERADDRAAFGWPRSFQK